MKKSAVQMGWTDEHELCFLEDVAKDLVLAHELKPSLNDMEMSPVPLLIACGMEALSLLQ